MISNIFAIDLDISKVGKSLTYSTVPIFINHINDYRSVSFLSLD